MTYNEYCKMLVALDQAEIQALNDKDEDAVKDITNRRQALQDQRPSWELVWNGVKLN